MGNQEEYACILLGSAALTGGEAEVLAAAGADTDTALVICADGGIRNARALGLRPDILVGDGDSGGFDGQERLPEAEYIRLPAEKDETDTLACARLALARGCGRFYLLGCSGGRLDHFFACVAVLEYLFGAGKEARLLDGGNDIRLWSGGILTFRVPQGFPYVSILALDRRVTGVTLQGMKYPLKNKTLFRDYPLGVSNEPVAPEVSVGVKTGRILIICSREAWQPFKSL